MRVVSCGPLICMLVLAASAAVADERSRIRIPLGSGGLNGTGSLRIDLAPERAELRYRVRGGPANTEQVISVGRYELARYRTDARGHASGRIDLLPSQPRGFAHDPRGTEISITGNLSAHVFEPPIYDEARTRIREATSIERVAATRGSIDARYETHRDGAKRLRIWLRDVEPGDYDVFVDDQLVATLTPNREQRGLVDLREAADGGGTTVDQASSPAVFRASAFPNARGKQIRVERDGAVQFEGSMLARIPGLSSCIPSSSTAPLTLAPGQAGIDAFATLDVDARCDLSFSISASGLAPGEHHLFLGGIGWEAFGVPSDGTLNAPYFERPDLMSGEQFLLYPVEPGTSVEIREYYPLGTDTVFSGALP